MSRKVPYEHDLYSAWDAIYGCPYTSLKGSLNVGQVSDHQVSYLCKEQPQNEVNKICNIVCRIADVYHAQMYGGTSQPPLRFILST
jgi:hypothetical protein